ncbi:RNA polymerase sigma factor [Candidatus Uabimicrobium sp. HlEnr_7]|uniref:RNA polymerase sigma factor n=1 Tax=Candidatus Uabimicrobium helgolandensis TaxID=3095367 RepID=UPI003558AA92
MSRYSSAEFEKLYRYEAVKVKAIMTRYVGIHNIDVVEDIVQETLVAALESWQNKLPDNPGGWLMDVAKKKYIDYLRRKIHYEKKILPQLQCKFLNTYQQSGVEEINDSLLRTIFYCCHPILQQESQVCLALKTLCGFNITEIASSLVTTKMNINKRLFRAKQKLRNENISFEIPQKALEKRLESVLLTLELLFNEGYLSSHPNKIIRTELCSEAIRLAQLLLNLLNDRPQIHGLLALMHLHMSRFSSRLGEQNTIITLEKQNRSGWNSELISKGIYHLQQATQSNTLCTHILKAGIAAEHSLAPDFSSTNWSSICRQYQLLLQIENTPIIQLNFAIAEYFNRQTAKAFKRLHYIEKKLDNYFLLPATLGELYFRENKQLLAKKYFEQALKATTSSAQKTFLKNKLSSFTT